MEPLPAGGYEPLLGRAGSPEPGSLLDRLSLCVWGRYGQGCDDYQAEAVRNWRRVDSWGLRTYAEPNRYCEYPRLSGRIPPTPLRSLLTESESAGLGEQLDRKARRRTHRAALVESLLCCDTVTEQLWSPLIVQLTYLVCVAYVLYLHFHGDFVSINTIEHRWGVPNYFSESIYIVLVLLRLVLIAGMTVGLCCGNNVSSPYYHILLAPICWVGFGVLFKTNPFGASAPGLSYTLSFLEVTIAGTLMLLLASYLAVALRLVLPAALSRRQYAFRYVKELLSDRRAGSDCAQLRYEGTRTAWKRQFYTCQLASEPAADKSCGYLRELQTEQMRLVSADGVECEDLVGFVAHLKQSGQSDRAIMDSLYRMQRAKLLNLQAARSLASRSSGLTAT